jgi:hypothetical protein
MHPDSASPSGALQNALAIAACDALIFGLGPQALQQMVEDKTRAMNGSPLHGWPTQSL